MESNQFQSMSREALLKQRKTTKFVIGLLAGALLTAFGINFYLGIKNGFTTNIVTPFAVLPIIIFVANNLKQIEKELANRKE